MVHRFASPRRGTSWPITDTASVSRCPRWSEGFATTHRAPVERDIDAGVDRNG